jgi:YesN/AraC family two-component response regulator
MLDESILKTIKILYVEDESVTRTHITKEIKQKVGKVIVAENGEDGIRKFVEHQPNIIITDLIMPDMSGIEMMRKIRNDGYKCPFIITSASSDTQMILEAVDLRIEKYIIKPIDVEALIKRLIEITVETLEQDQSLLVINNEFVLTEDKRDELELKIRNLYSAYLKRITGKGAKLIQVSLRGREIEVFLKENRTAIEESFLMTGNHHKSIEIIRKTIYENTIKEIEIQIEDLIKRKVTISKIEIYPKENYERMVFVIQ